MWRARECTPGSTRTLPGRVKASTRIRRGVALLLTVTVAAACQGTKHAASTATTEAGEHAGDPVAAIVAVRPPTGILAQRGFSAGPIAATGGLLFWEASNDKEGGNVVFLIRRNVATRETRVLARNLAPLYGLASVSDTLVFATRAAGVPGTELVATDLSGGHQRVLSRSLAAPFDARGDVVAWAEQAGARQRVIALNLRTGRRVVALDADPCRRGRCYRIDRVIVARDGVVFDLGSVGQGYPSLVARRRFDSGRTEFTRVPDDPQPDLARSADGALYYELRHGWFAWSFGDDHPRPIAGVRTWLLETQGSRQLVLKGKACGARLGFVASSGRTTSLPAPRATPVSPTQFGPLCRQLTGVVWNGNDLMIGWAFTPKISLQGHDEVGLASLITKLRLP
jgi:hypothetical protein